jgi:hypothetical protein
MSVFLSYLQMLLASSLLIILFRKHTSISPIANLLWLCQGSPGFCLGAVMDQQQWLVGAMA